MSLTFICVQKITQIFLRYFRLNIMFYTAKVIKCYFTDIGSCNLIFYEIIDICKLSRLSKLLYFFYLKQVLKRMTFSKHMISCSSINSGAERECSLYVEAPAGGRNVNAPVCTTRDRSNYLVKSRESSFPTPA